MMLFTARLANDQDVTLDFAQIQAKNHDAARRKYRPYALAWGGCNFLTIESFDEVRIYRVKNDRLTLRDVYKLNHRGTLW